MGIETQTPARSRGSAATSGPPQHPTQGTEGSGSSSAFRGGAKPPAIPERSSPSVLSAAGDALGGPPAILLLIAVVGLAAALTLGIARRRV
jgi:hypothetical protein